MKTDTNLSSGKWTAQMDSLTARAWNLRADQLSCHRRTGGGAGEPEIKIKEKETFYC